MSMNIGIYIKLGSTATRLFGIVQTTTAETDEILKEKMWQDRARKYLYLVGKNYPPYIVKHQQKIIGEAWRVAENNKGILEFKAE